MMKIKINLATYKYQSTAIPVILAAALFSFAVLYSVYNMHSYVTVTRQTAAYEKTLRRLKAESPSKGGRLSRGRMDALRGKVGFINNIIIKKSFSWTRFFSALEQTVPDRISIIEISPSFDDGTVQVQGMARSMKDILTFVDRLDSSREFSDAQLMRHTERKLKSGTRERLFFTLSVSYEGESEAS